MVRRISIGASIASASLLGNSGFDASKASTHVSDMCRDMYDDIPYLRAARLSEDMSMDSMVEEWERLNGKSQDDGAK